MLSHRLRAAIPLIGLALAAFLIPGWPGAALFAAFGLALALAAGTEFFCLAERMGTRGYRGLTLALGVTYLAVAGAGLPPGLDTALSVLVLAMLVFASFALCLREGRPTTAALAAVWVSVGAFVYLFWSLSFMVRLFFLPDATGRWLLLYVAAVTKLADTGAYAAGTLTARRPQGNHKLAPAISPKKSWEGLVGGTVAGVVVSLGVVAWVGDRLTVGGEPVVGWLSAVGIGIAASLVGLLGDLAESILKRAADAKDSGRIPGLGGALDMLDSLIPMGPLFYVYVRIASGS